MNVNFENHLSYAKFCPTSSSICRQLPIWQNWTAEWPSSANNTISGTGAWGWQYMLNILVQTSHTSFPLCEISSLRRPFLISLISMTEYIPSVMSLRNPTGLDMKASTKCRRYMPQSKPLACRGSKAGRVMQSLVSSIPRLCFASAFR